VPLEAYRRPAQGYHQMVVPAELGGMGLDAVSTIVILEEMAAADAGYAVTWHVNNVSLTMLLNMGSETRRGGSSARSWLARAASHPSRRRSPTAA